MAERPPRGASGQRPTRGGGDHRPTTGINTEELRRHTRGDAHFVRGRGGRGGGTQYTPPPGFTAPTDEGLVNPYVVAAATPVPSWVATQAASSATAAEEENVKRIRALSLTETSATIPAPLPSPPREASARRFLLICDVDGLFVDRKTFYPEVRYFEGHEVFVRWLFSNPEMIDVAIWTSGMFKNMKPIIDKALGPHVSELVFLWARDRAIANVTGYATIKPLSLVFTSAATGDRAHKVQCSTLWNNTNTIIIDDDSDAESKLLECNDPINCVIPNLIRAPDAAPGARHIGVDYHQLISTLTQRMKALNSVVHRPVDRRCFLY